LNWLSRGQSSSTKSAVLAGFVVLAVGVYAVPLFLRMPLTNDAQMYDLQVRLLEQGGVLYKDILEPNLPGVVWIQSLVRQIAGPSSEALKAFDLLAFAGVLLLIYSWFARRGWSVAGRFWLLAAAGLFYFSQSEWCHCQRDSWMLPLVLIALSLRGGLLGKLDKESASPAKIFLLALGEGLVWGTAIWLKPHVILPAALAWIIGTILARPGKRAIPDAGGLLAGGLIMGALGTAWMMHYGCWAPFWDTMRNWNPQYFAAGRAHWTLPRFLGLVWRMSPWILLHIPAVVVALRSIVRAFQAKEKDRTLRDQAILSACYLGWTGQAFFLQHLFDYIHAPTIILAMLVLAGPIHERISQAGLRTAVLAFAAIAILMSPLARPQRAGLWWTCVTTKSSPALKAKLAVLQNPDWEDLDQVAEFLRKQNATSHEVCCFHSDLVSLYNTLDLLPPTRFVYVQETLVFFPDRRELILETLRVTPHRFIVTDIVSGRLTPEQTERLFSPAYQANLRKPAKKDRPYPWGYPIVFRAGNYLVHLKMEEGG
jgi:hypothetical protein